MQELQKTITVQTMSHGQHDLEAKMILILH